MNKDKQKLKDLLKKLETEDVRYLTEEEEEEWLALKEEPDATEEQKQHLRDLIDTARKNETATAEFIMEQQDIEAAYENLRQAQTKLQILLWEAGLMREWQTQMRYQTQTDIDRRNNYLR